MNTSSWVTKSHMDCPWNISAPKGLQCGFIQWYQALATKNDDWNASRVLIAVLKILPSLPFEDQKVAYKSYCFGTYEPEDYELNPLSENQILTGFTVSLSRAQALMDLALMLRLRYPNGFQHEERFTDWYLSYNAALKYHSLASWFLSNVLDIEQVNLHRLKFEAQNTRFSQFLLSDLDPRAELDPSLKSVRIFPEWTLPLITSSDSERTSPRAEARNYKFDIPTLLNIQLHENVDLIGYIETCATLHSGIPCTSENDWSDTGSENKNSYPCAVAFDDLAFQTLSVALPLTEQDSISQYSRVIIDTSNGIIPTERTTSAAVKDFDFHQDSESEAFDIPLYLLFLHIFRGTSSGTLYDKTATLLPTLISDIRIETAAGVIQDIFEAELRGEQSRSKEHSFLTNEILCTIGNIKSDPSLSSYIWEGTSRATVF